MCSAFQAQACRLSKKCRRLGIYARFEQRYFVEPALPCTTPFRRNSSATKLSADPFLPPSPPPFLLPSLSPLPVFMLAVLTTTIWCWWQLWQFLSLGFKFCHKHDCSILTRFIFLTFCKIVYGSNENDLEIDIFVGNLLKARFSNWCTVSHWLGHYSIAPSRIDGEHHLVRINMKTTHSYWWSYSPSNWN